MTLDVSKRPLHGYEYTPLEQAAKDAALVAMKRDHPESHRVMNEWIYDYVMKEVGEKEFERRIETGYYDKRSKFSVHE